MSYYEGVNMNNEDGEYYAEIVNCTGSYYNHNYVDPGFLRREIMSLVSSDLTQHMNLKKHEGWEIVEIKKPEIKISDPIPGNQEYGYTGDTFVLWQRKPMAQAIFGD